MRHGIRLLTLLAATTVRCGSPARPRRPSRVTVPTLPAPLPPIQLPVSASVSGGTDGASLDVTVKAPGSTIGVGVEVPGVAKPPTVPGTPDDARPFHRWPSRSHPPPSPAPASPSPGVSPGPPVAVNVPEAHPPSPPLRLPNAPVRPVAAPTRSRAGCACERGDHCTGDRRSPLEALDDRRASAAVGRARRNRVRAPDARELGAGSAAAEARGHQLSSARAVGEPGVASFVTNTPFTASTSP